MPFLVRSVRGLGSASEIGVTEGPGLERVSSMLPGAFNPPLCFGLRWLEDVLGGGLGAGLSRMLPFLLLTPFPPSDLLGLAGDADVSDLKTSCGRGSGSICFRAIAGCGAISDFELFVRTAPLEVSPGDVDDHDTGVVVVVEALHGAGDSVKRVEGLLTVLTEGAGCLVCEGWFASACSSGMSCRGNI